MKVYLRHCWQLRNSEITLLLRAMVVIALSVVIVGTMDYADKKDQEAERQANAAQRATRMMADCLSDRLVLATPTVGIRCKAWEVKL